MCNLLESRKSFSTFESFIFLNADSRLVEIKSAELEPSGALLCAHIRREREREGDSSSVCVRLNLIWHSPTALDDYLALALVLPLRPHLPTQLR